MVPGLLDYVVQTRFGFHIIRVDQVIPGRLLPFHQVSNQIANALHAASVDRATQQYLKVLVSRASLDGISLDAESGLLVQ
jgi:peptidyl-prolyl cis-trans isomerase C